MSALRRLVCRLFGHPDSLVAWGHWRSDPAVGRYRVLTERCTRCDGVLALSSIVEGER